MSRCLLLDGETESLVQDEDDLLDFVTYRLWGSLQLYQIDPVCPIHLNSIFTAVDRCTW